MKQKRTIMMVILSTVFSIGVFAQSQTQIPVEKIAKLFVQGYSYGGKFHDGMAMIQLNGKYGYINKDGDLVVQCIYEQVEDFSNGLAIVAVRKDGKWSFDEEDTNKENPTRLCWGIIDKAGNHILPCEYPEINKVWSNFYKIRVEVEPKIWKFGTVDKEGKIVIPCVYDYINQMLNYYSLVYARKEKKFGVIDSLNNIIVPFGKYDDINNVGRKYRSSLFKVYKRSEGWGLINDDNKIIFPVSTCKDELGYYICYDGEVLIAKIGDSKYKIAVKGGSQILPEVFNEIQFSNRIIELRKGNEKLYITRLGVMLPKSRYSGYEFTDEKQGYFTVKCDKGYAIMDSYGKITSSFYEDILPNHLTDDRFYLVKNNYGKWGVIDFKGNTVIPCKYNSILSYGGHNYAIVKNENGKNAIIDSGGNLVFPYADRYYNIRKNGDIMFRENENGKYGLISKDCKKLLSGIYDEIGNRCDGLIPVKKGGVWGYADENGHSTFDYKFDNVQNEQIEAKPAQKENKPQVKEKKKKSKFLNFINKVMEEGKKQQ